MVQDKDTSFKLHSSYNIEMYACGLAAGQKLQLKDDLRIIDHRGKPTGMVYEAGSIWLVLHGCSTDPNIVWLLDPTGERHTWDDDDSIFTSFEVLPEPDSGHVS